MLAQEVATNLTNNSTITNNILFSWFDYTLFGLLLGVSTAIGVYFGFFSKQDNVAEYILGGRTMKTFPIAMSLIASDVSAMAFIGVPADIYLHGASYWLTLIAIATAGYISYKVYLPVFYRLQLTSCFEYLQLRFDGRNSMFASFLICLAMFLCSPLCIYVPALAFNQVTGISIHSITPVVCVVCIFYTTIGGLKAVVWTDTIQLCIMCITMTLVLILGIISTDGLQYVFQKSYEGGRLFLWDVDPDPTNRTSVWSPTIGMVFSWIAYVVASQICNQKFQALPTYENVKRSLIIFIVGLLMLKSISVISGLIIYAKYSDCDPVATQKVSNSDQIVPYYVMNVAGMFNGIPGLFIAGIFSAALSTMSTTLNTLAGLIYEDFLKHFLPDDTTEKTASTIMKILVVVIGLYATGMVHVVEHLGSIFPLAVSLGDMTAGPLLGMFTLGMLVPSANSKGTLSGAICGLLAVGWIVMGAQYHILQGAVVTPNLPTSVDGCTTVFNNITDYHLLVLGQYRINRNAYERLKSYPELKIAASIMYHRKVHPVSTTNENGYTSPWIYRISFYYYSMIGTFVTMIVGIAVSVLTGGTNQNIDRDLLSPVIYSLLKDEQSDEMNSFDIKMQTVNKDIKS